MTALLDAPATGPSVPAARPERRWDALHVFLRWDVPDLDDFLVTAVRPLLAGLRADGGIADWFFIRYAEGGLHLRLRVRAATPAALVALQDGLRAAVDAATYPVQPAPKHWAPHGSIRPAAYEPETRRYGGPAALAGNEDAFCRSSEVALDLLATRPTPAVRIGAALDLIAATAEGLDLDDAGVVTWLRTNAFAWRWHRTAEMAAPAAVQANAAAQAAAQAPALVRRWTAIRAAAGVTDATSGTATDVATGTATGRAVRWAAAVRAARAELEPGSPVTRSQWLGVWASQLHMLCNRLGLLPDQERSASWFVAHSLLAPAGPVDYFDPAATAPDRAYLAASGYHRARMSAQQPREVPKPAPLLDPNPLGRPPVPLPAGPAPTATLTTALSARQSGRGRLTGPVTAAELGTLLWTATAPTGREPVRWADGPGGVYHHRPYPSAGAQFTARLRVIARDVTGLEPGTYAVDELNRSLIRRSAAPTDEELLSTSMWFVPEPPGHDRVVVPGLPVLLGLYVELGALRERYGLRALKFALLEAGHVAQNLALTAAAMGLGLGTLGGFYDDPAHEVFMLDGLSEVLVYLLPVGRPQP